MLHRVTCAGVAWARSRRRPLQWRAAAGSPRSLGEQQTALDRGERGCGELSGLRPAVELAVLPSSRAGRRACGAPSARTRRRARAAPPRRPPRAGPRASRAGSRRGPRAPPAAPPASRTTSGCLPAVERTREWDYGEHCLGVVDHDGAQQRGPILEVVVELALARAGALDHVVEARLGAAALVHELGGRRHEALACGSPACGGWSRGHGPILGSLDRSVQTPSAHQAARRPPSMASVVPCT